MRCKTFINSVDDFLDSQLPQAKRLRFEKHLNSCACCRDELVSLQSLIEMCARLPRSIQPDRDLWPQIAAALGRAGLRESNQGQPASSFELESGFRFPWISRRIWQLAAAAILGLALILTAVYLRNRPSSTPTKPALKSDDAVKIGLRHRPSAPALYDLKQEPNRKQSPARPLQDEEASAGFIEACRCEPSPEVLSLINKAWMVDTDALYHLPRRQTVAERLYQLAGENADNFFLHKASIDATTFPVIGTVWDHNTVDRYRIKFTRRPNDPVFIYLFAHTLFGKDTPQMIQLMQQLTGEYPEFPWPYLDLAKVYREAFYRDDAKATVYLQAFMNLCPKSPEPISLLGSLRDSDFFTQATKRMRSNMAARTDIPSLLLYDHLWLLESFGGATGEESSKVREEIKSDLERLRSLEAANLPEIAELIRLGYSIIGDRKTSYDLAKRDTSYLGRWDVVRMEIKDWNEKNPFPPDNAPEETKESYWIKRLQASNSWIRKVPESPSIWILRLEALAALKSRPESEFLEVAKKALALERDSGEYSGISPEGVSWGSNILKLALLCAQRGVWLDKVPELIKEGVAAAYQYSQQTASDITGDLQWSLLRGRFSTWLKADDAWQSLVIAYLRQGKPDKARETLNRMEEALTAIKSELAQRLKDNTVGSQWLFTTQYQWMKGELAAREKQYAALRAAQ